jgi:hypothetical protein
MHKYLRQPIPSAVVAAIATYIYLMLRTRLNGQEKKPNNYYIKPAFLVGVLVFFIVKLGQSEPEPIIKDMSI